MLVTTETERSHQMLVTTEIEISHQMLVTTKTEISHQMLVTTETDITSNVGNYEKITYSYFECSTLTTFLPL